MSWYQRFERWIKDLDPLVADPALAVLLAAMALVTVMGSEPSEALREPGVVAGILAVVASAPVALRRLVPLGSLLAACAATTVYILLDYPEGTIPIGVLVLTYSVAANTITRRAVVGLCAVVATIVVAGVVDESGQGVLDVIQNVAIWAAAWTVGIAVRSRREAADARVLAAEERVDVERQHARRAVVEERLRIAQDLHDVVAHSMSVIAVQAGVGGHLLDDNPEQARAALNAISDTSRSTLAEMRRLLGVLRDDDGARSHTPAPSLADLTQLVADVRSAGVPVNLDIGESGDDTDRGIQLAAYRIVQEALTNVIKHAGSPSRVDVRVRRRPDELVVEIVDDGRGLAAPPTSGAGHGLVGMRERVEAWGGQVTAGPRPGGGYHIRASFPREGET